MTAAALRAWRKANGWTQTEMAEWLGVHMRSVLRWELGQMPIPLLVARAVGASDPLPFVLGSDYG